MTITKPKTNCWSIYITVPEQWGANENQIRDRNEHIGVVADTMEEAMEEVRSQIQNCRFISVHHRGKVHFQK